MNLSEIEVYWAIISIEVPYDRPTFEKVVATPVDYQWLGPRKTSRRIILGPFASEEKAWEATRLYRSEFDTFYTEHYYTFYNEHTS